MTHPKNEGQPPVRHLRRVLKERTPRQPPVPLPRPVADLQKGLWEIFAVRMKHLGLGIKEVYSAAGMSKQTWYYYRNAEYVADLVDLYKISQKLEKELVVRVVSPGSAAPTPGEGPMHDPISEAVASAMDGMTIEDQRRIQSYVNGVRDTRGP